MACQRKAISQLRSEQQTFSAETQEVAQLAAQNESIAKLREENAEAVKLREENRDLPRLRNQARQLRRELEELDKGAGQQPEQRTFRVMLVAMALTGRQMELLKVRSERPNLEALLWIADGCLPDASLVFNYPSVPANRMTQPDAKKRFGHKVKMGTGKAPVSLTINGEVARGQSEG